jgi:nitrogen fixation/metabolism regulation signal transduction histidine kinase
VSLRTRLFLALLALAVLPTAVFTLFTLDQLNRALDRWFYRPGVARALEAGLEVGKGALARLESTLTAQAASWAARWPEPPIPEARRLELAESLRGTGVDFVQLYRRNDLGRWVLIDQIAQPGTLVADPLDASAELDGALAAGRLRSPSGLLGGVARMSENAVLVAGARVQKDFFAQLEHLGQGAVYYRQLGLTVDLQRRAYVLLVGAMVLAVVGIALLVSRAIARETSRPIQELSAGLARVAAGDVSARVVPSGARELERLGTGFNEMTERLETAREALQEAEREAAWRDVARKLAHEFKNILTPMRLNLQLLDARLDTVPDAQREAFQRNLASVLREVEHLGRLTEQFGQYARLPEPRLEPLDLADLADSVIAAEPSFADRVALRRDGPAPVLGDPLLLARAIQNLALNALEASPPGVPVEIAVTRAAGRVTLEVRDRGPGLPPEMRDRLFEPYVSTKRRGSGLGLSLVRDIVVQHGGAVTLADREGGGAVAALALAAAPATPSAAARRESA